MTARGIALALAALVLAAAACGGSGTGTASTRSPTPTRAAEETPPPRAATASPRPTPTPAGRLPTPTVVPAATATDLTFTGSLATRVRSATTTEPCGKGLAGFDAELSLTLGGQPSLLSIAIFDYHGPGTYGIPPERVSVRVGPPGGPFMPATRGSVVVDAGDRSGRIDTALGDDGTRVTGTWACS